MGTLLSIFIDRTIRLTMFTETNHQEEEDTMMLSKRRLVMEYQLVLLRGFIAVRVLASP